TDENLPLALHDKSLPFTDPTALDAFHPPGVHTYFTRVARVNRGAVLLKEDERPHPGLMNLGKPRDYPFGQCPAAALRRLPYRLLRNQQINRAPVAPRDSRFKSYSGEPGGTRTRDPVLKRHMLYLLSYRP